MQTNYLFCPSLLQAHVCNWELHGSPPKLRLWPNKAVYPHLSQLLEVPRPPASSTAAHSPQHGTTSSNSSSSGNDDNTSSSSTPATTEHLLDWALLQQLLQSGNWASTGSLQLLAGGSDALLPARYETHDRLLNQVAGRMQVRAVCQCSLVRAPPSGFSSYSSESCFAQQSLATRDM